MTDYYFWLGMSAEEFHEGEPVEYVYHWTSLKWVDGKFVTEQNPPSVESRKHGETE